MSENMLIAISVIVFIPITIWLKGFLDAVTAKNNQEALESNMKNSPLGEGEKNSKSKSSM